MGEHDYRRHFPTAYGTPIGPVRPRRRRTPTGCCGLVIPRNAARAEGRFKPGGPDGYRAADTPDAALRPTRAEAERDWHAARCTPTPEEQR